VPGYAFGVTGSVRGVSDVLAGVVRHRGSIPFDEFMDRALYAPGGYYDRPPVGPDGDFVTSPHVHWWFAYALALALGELREALDGPDAEIAAAPPARLVELGAGDATLARQLLEILADAGPIEYVAVERSAGARAALAGLGLDVRASVHELGPIDGSLLFANELLDNLPFCRVRRRRAGELVEVRVGMRAGRFVEIEAPIEDPLRAVADPLTESLEPDSEATVPTGVLALIDALAKRMRDSYLLLIDYATELGRGVHGYRAQRVVEDVLERPGSTDITAPVDFDLVEARARERGLVVLGRVPQRDALIALGLAEWAEAERGRGGPIGGSTRAWAERSRASLLVERGGLGAHRWSLLGTTGLPTPSWLRAARDRPSSD
jgi:SAM-dependent MidA family methyltransferase